MNRNITPRPIKASGARDAHGRILDPASGALYVHMHRESGLAHRHYVLKAWQVRLLAIAVSRPMLLLYLIALLTWGWMASQAARVPGLRDRIATLTSDAQRLDTLSARLEDMRVRYEQVQKMLGGAGAVVSRGETTSAATPSTRTNATPTAPRTELRGDSTARTKTAPKPTPRPDSMPATKVPPAAGMVPPG